MGNFQASPLPEHDDAFETLFRPGQILSSNAKLYRPEARPKQHEDDVRVMQWNVLADGLSLDGFITPMVTQEFVEMMGKVMDVKSPSHVERYVPVISFSPDISSSRKRPKKSAENSDETDEKKISGALKAKSSPFSPGGEGVPAESEQETESIHMRNSGEYDNTKRMIQELKDLGKLKGKDREDACEQFISKYDTALSRRNLGVVMAFRGRLLRYLSYIRAVNPDILTLQEVDHYEDISEALSHLGYTSEAKVRRRAKRGSQGGNRYVPLWRRSPAPYLRMLKQDNTGRCFAPKMNSSAFSLMAERISSHEALIRGQNETAFLRGTLTGRVSISVDDVAVTANNVKKIRKENSQNVPESLAKIGVTGPLDDDGVAIFWKKSRFEPVSTADFCEISPHTAAVKVALRDLKTKKVYSVVCAHLASGIGSERQMLRAKQIKAIKAFLPHDDIDRGVGVRHISSRNNRRTATILCLDANADPFESPLSKAEKKKKKKKKKQFRAIDHWSHRIKRTRPEHRECQRQLRHPRHCLETERYVCPHHRLGMGRVRTHFTGSRDWD